jgi:hypothetical protein
MAGRSTKSGGKTKNNQADQQHERDIKDWKPGSDPVEAGQVGAARDFGVPVNGRSTRDIQYTSENTKASDPNRAKPRSGEEPQGVRTSGAGWTADSVGAGSGGDLDTSVLGLGTEGAGVAATGPGDPAGADDVIATAPAGKVPTRKKRPVPDAPVDQAWNGSVESAPADQDSGVGADAATNAARGDDSFAGEISAGEADGDDEPVSPSSDSQGLSEDDNQAYPQVDMRGDA